MDYWFLMAAAAISLVGMVFHGFIGGKIYISNVNDSDMETLTKSLSIVSWHVFTIFLFASASTLIYVAYNPEFTIAVYPIIGINLLGSLLFVFLGLGRHRALLRMPGAVLMGTTALLAWLGI
ncbi:hypothetical protein ACMAY4_11750 [Porticoccaceae bacterium nBUS_17]|jgi:glucan phosphoethanolaminetransferase (alkaline phosphatase superfamily)|nr:hypothetical protein [Porticoccaceae bacterium]MDG1783452.1 hypothetical protein [Porticoccaceae bacterium]|tara:strand:- start:99 stop:464 length:366 start_codon:yes stop_codon:yes gene_type:complete